ncbi:MAG: DNA replication/repair protein RecF, partial [Thermoleophilaceae bacterium]
LGLPRPAELSYRPRSAAADAPGLAAELRERRPADLERGFTAHGPHRDELRLQLEGAPLRAYGSQGQQRTALLALLFAEREVLASRRRRSPLMLLDDVMSELDTERRDLLAGLLRESGQAVVTATEPEHVPDAGEDEIVRVSAGSLTSSVLAEPRP